MEIDKLPFLFCVCSAVFTIALAEVYTCGQFMCLCSDKKHAICKPDRSREDLIFFPILPSNIIEVTFQNYERQNISRSDLLNLTHLPLKTLRLKQINITHMQEGLFQSFPKLQTLEILQSSHLTSETLRDSFKNITSKFKHLTLTSVKLNFTVKDMFKNLEHTRLKTLVLAGNRLLDFHAGVIQNLNLLMLDLSSSEFNKLTKLCPANSTTLLPTIHSLRLRSTKIKTIPNNFIKCFPNLKTLSFDNTRTGLFPSALCFYSQQVTNHLSRLSLGNTGIRGNISNKHLRCLTKLTKFKLDTNKISNVPQFCKSESTSSVPNLSHLSLQRTSISTLVNDSFKCLTALQSLDLSHNLLKHFPTFCGENKTSYTPKLTSLLLRNTSIITHTGHRFYCLKSLKTLDLQDNCFRDIPQFCDESNKSVNPFLENLILSQTKIQYIFNDSFLCLSSLRTLELSYTSIVRLEDNIFSSLMSLKLLYIGYVKQLKWISTYAFNSSSLKELKFIQNNFDFSNTSKYSPKNLFKFCPNVTTLDLSGNHFSTGPLGQEILKPLKKLAYLFLA